MNRETSIPAKADGTFLIPRNCRSHASASSFAFPADMSTTWCERPIDAAKSLVSFVPPSNGSFSTRISVAWLSRTFAFVRSW